MAIMQRLKQRFWWIDVFYPLGVAIFLISVITAIVYAGRPSSRLALLAEQELLNFSLKLSPERHVLSDGNVLIVTADSLEMQSLPRAPRGLVPDVAVETYVPLIRKLAALGTQEIVVLWNGDTQRFDAAYLEPLIATLMAMPPSVRVSFATSTGYVSDLQNALSPFAAVLDSSSCLYPDVDLTHSSCFYSKDWGNMLAQWLAETLAPNLDSTKGRTLTYALPSNAASYITRLPPLTELSRVSFSRLLSNAFTPVNKPRIAIVGVDVRGSMSPAAKAVPARFVRTIFDPRGGDPALTGTPLPFYWGQMAQTLVDQSLVKVPSPLEDKIITVTFCLMMLGVMISYGGVAASGAFVFYVALSPLVNAFSMAFADSYVPLFNSFYFGLSTLVLSGFGRLSYTAWHKWRAQAKSKAMHDAAELKGHFISLLSHNLNTPVAKMQGMLQILAQSAPKDVSDDISARQLKEAERLATLLQFIIRAVLIATALEENEKALSPRTAKQLASDFVASYKSTLSKLGVTLRDIKIKVDPPDAQDLEFVPVQLDIRAVTMAMAGAAYLFVHRDQDQDQDRDPDIATPEIAVPVDLELTIRETQDPLVLDGSGGTGDYGLTVRLSSTAGRLPETAPRILARSPDFGFRSRTDGRFLQEVLCGLIAVTARSFGGMVQVEASSLRIDLEGQA